MPGQYVEYMTVPNDITGAKEKRYIRDKAAQNTLLSKADKNATVSTVAYDSTNKKLTKTINGTTTDIVTTATLKTAMALNNVENKSSATIRGELTSSNVTTALGYTPINPSVKGIANGIATLDEAGKVPSTQLPSYVDDVIEGYYYNSKFYTDNAHTTEITGESGKIYVDLTEGARKVYRWGGTAYAEIPIGLALGTSSSTAYRGDRGNTAYKHAVTNKGSAFSSGLYKITTNAEGHVTAAESVIKSDITDLGVPAQDTTYNDATQSVAGLMSVNDKKKLDGIATGATANTGTVTSVSAGVGLAGGPVTTTGSLNVNITSETKLTNEASDGTETSGRVYPVRLDKNGKLCVNVPWTDTTSFVPTTRKVNGKALLSDITLTANDVSAAPNTTVSCTTDNVKTALGVGSGTARFFREDGTWQTPAGSGIGTVTQIDTGAGLTGGPISSSGTISLESSGVSAGSYGPSQNITGTDNTTMSVPYITVDVYGRVTSIANKTYTSKNTTYSNATTSAAGLMSSSDKTKLDGMTAITDNEIDALFA